MINTELARKLYDFILENPDLHNQENFDSEAHCGTAHCVAGWIAHWDGFTSEELAGNWDSYVSGKLGIPYEHATVLIYDTTNDQALDALYSLSEGRLPEWDDIGVL